jgi:hypothetical protein
MNAMLAPAKDLNEPSQKNRAIFGIPFDLK